MTAVERVKLFFIAGMAPTEQEVAEAKRLGFDAFRNVSLVYPDSPHEHADEVAGLVPASYRRQPHCKIHEPQDEQPKAEQPEAEQLEIAQKPKPKGR